MDFENEKKEEQQLNNSTASRDGYQKEYRPVGRSPRPRIHTTPRPVNNNFERPSFNKNSQDDEGGFRPEGFGAGLQSAAPQRSYRPRTNTYNNNGGYQSRPQGDYQPRGGYQQRPQQGGYRPRYNQDGDEQGYQPRQGGYQPRGGVTTSVLSRVAISNVVVTTSVLSRVAISNVVVTTSVLRVASVSVLPTMIPMQSTL